ncbi:MAG: hypothetical protein U1E11_11640, partial [Dethiobacteria bacterium]|nr:hypothetical protein [Dethiobacteria bacterium]
VYLMAALAQRMLGVPMPVQLAAKMDGDGETLQALISAEEMIFSRGAGTTRYLARLFGKQSLKVKLNYLKQRLFPPGTAFYQGEERVEDRNALQKYRHYYFRLRDLLKRHGKTVWCGLLGNRETLAAMDAQNERNKLRDWLTGVKS